MGVFDCVLDFVRSGRAGLSRRSYVLCLGPIWLLSGISFFYSVYGWGVWIVPLSDAFCRDFAQEARW